jgi:hypothetical protein
MKINNTKNSGNFPNQKNIISGFRVIEDEWMASKAGLPSGLQREGAGWVRNSKDAGKPTSTLCRHVLSGMVKAHKVCFKNFECYHCAYDQMLDDQAMDVPKEKLAC